MEMDLIDLIEEEQPHRSAATAASPQPEADGKPCRTASAQTRAVFEQRQAAMRAAIQQTRRYIQEELELRVGGCLLLRIGRVLVATRQLVQVQL
jgi:hypothetical protein